MTKYYQILLIAKCIFWLIIFASLAYYFYYTSTPNSRLMVYQDQWGSALSFACTGEMGVINLSAVPDPERTEAARKLASFLKPSKATPTFDCRDLPVETKIEPLSTLKDTQRFFQRYQVGMYGLAGIIWMITGPSWFAIAVLSSLFAAGATLTLFIVASKFGGPLPAIAVSSLFAVHPTIIFLVPFIRDYSKMFFIFTTFFLLFSILVHKFRNVKSLLVACGLFGTFSGAAVAFRQDMTTAAFLSALIIMFVIPAVEDITSPHRNFYKLRGLLASASFLCGYFALVVPLYMFVPVAQGHEGHFMMLGLANEPFANAGLVTDGFIFNPVYMDYYGYAILEASAIARTGKATIVPLSEEYNRISIYTVIGYIMTFPSYVLGRIFNIILDITSNRSISLIWPGFKWMPMAVSINSAVFLVVTYIVNKRVFSILIMFFVGMATVLSIQYMPRHYIHIHFLWLAVSSSGCLLVLSALARRFGDFRLGTNSVSSLILNARSSEWPNQVPRFLPLALVGGLAVSYVLVSHANRFTVDPWIQTVLKQPVRPTNFTITPTSDGNYVLWPEMKTIPDFRGLDVDTSIAATFPPQTFTGGYLEIRLRPSSGCGKEIVKLTVNHDFSPPGANRARATTIELNGSLVTSHFTPVFVSKEWSFAGISIGKEDVQCVDSMAWIENFPMIRMPVEFTTVRQRTSY